MRINVGLLIAATWLLSGCSALSDFGSFSFDGGNAGGAGSTSSDKDSGPDTHADAGPDDKTDGAVAEHDAGGKDGGGKTHHDAGVIEKDSGTPPDPLCEAAGCAKVATCDSSGGTAVCTCPDGYLGDGTTCTDLNECFAAVDPCPQEADCNNKKPGFTCDEKTGFDCQKTKTGYVCFDECLVLLSTTCSVNALCSKPQGSGVCRCKFGYVDTSTAQDGSICTVDTTCSALTCDALALCDNTGGTPKCVCPEGYAGNGTTCMDVDECADMTDTCSPNADCSNTPGGYLCDCKKGFTGDGMTCVDDNECATHKDNCSSNATCSNVPAGSFSCTCNTGYSGDGVTCKDDDECMLGTAGCSPNANCMNTQGSATCMCKPGYTGNGTSCTDTDECATNNGGCGVGVPCANSPGSFSCGCAQGQKKNASNVCVDIDECADRIDNCSPNGTCTNVAGAPYFTCACKTGYAGNGVTCMDVDECALSTTNNCSSDAACTNSAGSYSCKCKTGFSGNGVTCTDDDECALSTTNNCNTTRGSCTNVPGSYTCACNAGYTGNGVSCTDVDECALGSDNCDSSPDACVNSTGSYSCLCPQYYTGSPALGGNNGIGTNGCADVNECATNNGGCGSAAFFTCTNNVGAPQTCTDIDKCATNHGGCDALATCTNNSGAAPTCGACPTGYTGTGATSCTIVNCGALSSPSNGTVTTAGGTTYNHDGTYACNTGYTISSSAARTCQASGSWSGTAPTCTVVNCNALANPTNGTATTANGTTYNQVGTYACSAGYILTGASSRTCQAGGAWSGAAPTCVAADCGALTSPTNGSVNTSNGTSYPQSATYSCNVGYAMSGNASRACQTNGTWAGSAPTCTLVDCNALTNPTNGTVSTAGGTTYGKSATYTCSAGYTVTGSTPRTCQANGAWSGNAPTCTPADCGTLTNPTNGTVTTLLGTTYGQNAVYVCNSGYALVGTSPRTCQSNSAWSGTAPTCAPVDCGALAGPTNGSVSTPSGTTYTQSASYSCNTGYTISSSATRSCQANATWSGSAPTCTIVSCPALSNPTNGTVNTSNGTTYLQNATYACSAGYTLIGSSSRTCQASGAWAGSAPTCSVVDCGSLTNPTNGTVSTSNGTTYGQSATYACSSGYALAGTSPRSCQANGSWSGTAPTCPAVDCGALGNPSNGTVNTSNGTTYGQTATYSCSTGYTLTGSASRSCQAAGTWSSSAPTCVIVSCPALTNPTNGTVATAGGVTYGQNAVYSCSSGYAVTGTSPRTCQANGTWTSTAPTCTFIDCGALAAPSNGSVSTPTGTTYNQTATYSCNSGFAISGSSTRTCQQAGTWSNSAPVCNDINECSTSTHTCSSNSTCTNTTGSYTCACNVNYVGNGYVCVGPIASTFPEIGGASAPKDVVLPVAAAAVGSPTLECRTYKRAGAVPGFATCSSPLKNSTVEVTQATWDPSWSVTGVTYSNGNLSIAGNSVNTKNVRTTSGVTRGRWYWEVKATGGTAGTNKGGIGILEAAMPNNAAWIGNVASGVSFGYGDGTYYLSWANAAVGSGNAPTTASITSGNTYMFALDMDHGNLWAGQNGVWFNGGNPATGVKPAVIGLSGTVYPGVTFYASSLNAFTANFGPTGFSYPAPPLYTAGLSALNTAADGAWRTDMRWVYGGNPTPVFTYDYYVHSSLHTATKCPALGATDTAIFTAADAYLKASLVGAGYADPGAFAVGSQLTSLANPFVAISFVPLTSGSFTLHDLVTNPTAGNKYEEELWSLRRRFVMSSNGRYILFRRTYSSRGSEVLNPVHGYTPDTNNCRAATFEVGDSHYATSTFSGGIVDFWRTYQRYTCDAVVVNRAGAGVCVHIAGAMITIGPAIVNEYGAAYGYSTSDKFMWRHLLKEDRGNGGGGPTFFENFSPKRNTPVTNVNSYELYLPDYSILRP